MGSQWSTGLDLRVNVKGHLKVIDQEMVLETSRIHSFDPIESKFAVVIPWVTGLSNVNT